jgi:hypothetical protein
VVLLLLVMAGQEAAARGQTFRKTQRCKEVSVGDAMEHAMKETDSLAARWTVSGAHDCGACNVLCCACVVVCALCLSQKDASALQGPPEWWPCCAYSSEACCCNLDCAARLPVTFPLITFPLKNRTRPILFLCELKPNHLCQQYAAALQWPQHGGPVVQLPDLIQPVHHHHLGVV